MPLRDAKPWGSWTFCILLVLFGLCCHAIIMATNFEQGSSFGHDERSKNIYAFGALAIDFAGVGVCSALLGFLRRRNERALFLSVVIWSSGLFSLLMFYGYGATNRIEPTRQAALKHSSEITAQAKSEVASAEARAEVLGFLQDEFHVAADAARKKQAKKEPDTPLNGQQIALLDRLNQATSIEVKAAPVEQNPDPMAATLATRVGWTTTAVQEILSVVPGALLLALSSVLIRRGFQNWPQPPMRRALPGCAKVFPARPRGPMLRLVPADLTDRQRAVFEALARIGRPARNGELAQVMGVSQTESTRRVNSLSAYLEKRQNGRCVEISLKPQQPEKSSRRIGFFHRKAPDESSVKAPSDNVVSMAV